MKRWYLLYCKRGEQQRAQLHLDNQSVECFYPKIWVEKIHKGKQQKRLEPLFPSYLFVRFDFELGPCFTTVRSTRGVVDFVRLGLIPHEVPAELIDQLKLLDAEKSCQVVNQLPEQGQMVHVARGQFAGIDAIYQQPDGETRSIMLVNMISQQVPISIENTDWEIT
ncbi:transcription/translation regulatory transformer protein RfaH [Vibrio misgurnus]|uniref:transcription/translation regulatory transformer protein RfaH n=1 Tax=Vibrio misgurnus TaxID=2993714 RepID=UPI002415A369|nr:transcription/translation regulatory transformer protein RfaH [Vibrio sp. gvc]